MTKLQSWILVIGVIVIAANSFEWASWKRTIAEVIRPNYYSVNSNGCKHVGLSENFKINEDGIFMQHDCRLRSRIADYFDPPPAGYEGVWFGNRPRVKPH